MMAEARWCRIRVRRPDGTLLGDHELRGHGDPDLGAVDAVAHIMLAATRRGEQVVLRDVAPALRALLELAGLPVEMEWEPERGEQTLRVEERQEEAHRRDPAI